jgi:hypothetical protein
VTSDHEQEHLYLTISSLYGRALERTKKRSQETTDLRDARVLEVLVRESRDVGEMVATYGSLQFPHRRALVQQLPATYRAAFDRLAEVVEYSFQTPLLRGEYANAIGRCMWMATPDDALLDSVRLGQRRALPKNIAPDARFERARRALLELPADAVATALRRDWLRDDAEKYFVSQTREDFTKDYFDRDETQSHSSLVFLTSSFMYVLCELLETTLPGLTDSYSDFRLYRGSQIGWTESSGSSFDFFEPVRSAAHHRIAALPDVQIPVQGVRQPTDALASVGSQSLQRSGVLYGYIWESDNEAVEGGLLALSTPDPGTAQVIWCPIDQASTTALRHWSGRILTVVAQHSLTKVEERAEHDTAMRALLESDCFVHLEENPVDFLVSALDSGRSVRWAPMGVAYPTDSILEHHGLQLVVYLVDGMPVMPFHLSNLSVTGAIKNYEDNVIGDRARIAWFDPEGGQYSTFVRAISPLIDHPLVVVGLRYGQSVSHTAKRLGFPIKRTSQ